MKSPRTAGDTLHSCIRTCADFRIRQRNAERRAVPAAIDHPIEITFERPVGSGSSPSGVRRKVPRGKAASRTRRRRPRSAVPRDRPVHSSPRTMSPVWLRLENGKEAAGELGPMAQLSPARREHRSSSRRATTLASFVQSTCARRRSPKVPGVGHAAADLIRKATWPDARRREVRLAQGLQVSTYATWWIRQALPQLANTNRTIRLPVHAGDNLARVRRACASDRLRSSSHRCELAADLT